MGVWPGGYRADMSAVVRPAGDGDVEQIVELIRDRIGEEDAPEAELVLRDGSYDRSRWSVVEEDGAVVSTMAAFPMSFHYGNATLSATNFEFVATAGPYEGRGFVRRQFDYHHRLAAEHDELIQVVVGIPYFYRTLGYEYALRVRPLQILTSDATATVPADWEVRQASAGDVDLVLGLQQGARPVATVAFSHSAQLWSFILSSPVYRTLIAYHRGSARAMGRIYLDEGTPILTDVVASDGDGLAAIVAASRRLAPGEPTFLVSRTGVESLLSAWKRDDYSYAYYVRIGDPVTFLNAVRPVLEARLETSPFEAQRGDALISLYRSSITFSHEEGALSPFARAGPEPAPGARGGAGVPPDLFCTLVLGDVGVDQLAHRHADFRPGKLRELLQVLFPKVDSDVASWVVP